MNKLIMLLTGSLKQSFLYLFFILSLLSGCESDSIYKIPETSSQSKPWTRWWWMGSSVTKSGISQHLEAFKDKGLGGVEIVPIYGEKGDEENFIPYLSDQWIDMLLYTLREAERLDLGVDMTLGTGWPYGGPWITEEYTARRYERDTDDGEITGQKVKRAAPGATGLVVDHFNPEAMLFFLEKFDSLMVVIRKEGLPLRSIFNDSYEVYGSDWTHDFKDVFLKDRGYPFNEGIFNPSILHDSIDAFQFWQDYHKTINDLVLETVGNTIYQWSSKHELQYRYQAHGSPSNLLDLYATATIPETESFGSSKFNIPLVEFDPDFNEDNFSRPHPLIFKFASSPAHIMGKKMVSSETATWLGDHFKVSLSQVKPQIDELFTNGINHIFYHGIPYSPFEKEFPGRRFYASTNFGPSSALWNYFDNLNLYIGKCQSILQNTTPDNDLLLYFPVYDLWDKKGENGNSIMQGVHNPEDWLYNTPFGETAQKLLDEGYAFDYISDQQIDLLIKNTLENSHTYKALIVPNCLYLPNETLENLTQLKEKGISVYFINDFPFDVPGYHNHAQRKLQHLEIIKEGRFSTPLPNDEKSISKALLESKIYPEVIKTEGLSFIRKSHENGYMYFISNLSDHPINGYYPITKKFSSVEIFDPLTGKRGLAQTIDKEGGEQIRLQISPGQSIFLITYNSNVNQKSWEYIADYQNQLILNKGWTISIMDRITDYPIDSLYSWTELPFSWAPFYSGTAKYSIELELEAKILDSDAVILDLGDLKYMAAIWLNDTKIDEIFCVPFQTRIPIELFKKKNKLEIEVTNLDANQVIQLDKEKIQWKNFYDINIVNINYKSFDATEWDPVSSGLPGPVHLIPISLD